MRQQLYLSAFVLVASAFVASTASADIFSDCADAIERDDIAAVQDMALTIQQMGYIPVRRQDAADVCVSVGTGEIPLGEAEVMRAERAALREAELAAQKEATEIKAEAVRQRICELQDVVTETQETIRQAEAAQRDRRIETLAATIQECSTWFEDDARGALTNDVCNSIFSTGGLPNSVISGPTTSEALLAEITNKNAYSELNILITGMVLKTYATEVAEIGTIEGGGDPYDCRE